MADGPEKTIRAQFGKRAGQATDGLLVYRPDPDASGFARVDARLDSEELLTYASDKHRQVLYLRLVGLDDDSIAGELGVKKKSIPVFAHRGIGEIRKACMN